MIGRALMLSSVLLALGCSGPEPRSSTLTVAPLRGHDIPDLGRVGVTDMTPPMVDFLNQRVGRHGTLKSRLDRLAEWLGAPHGQAFVYDVDSTLTAAEAFREARGNCVGFANLYLAMARALGAQAYFQEVVTTPTWNDSDGTLISNQHLNIRVRLSEGAFSVDAQGALMPRAIATRVVDDGRGKAHYFSNLGVTALLEGDLPLGYAYFSRAIQLAPDAAFAWTNLGVLFNRNGQPKEAETAYRHAMSLDQRSTSAASNLARLLLQQQRFEEANALQASIAGRQKANPYYWWLKGQQLAGQGQLVAAIDNYRQAIELKNDDHRLYLALANALFDAGQKQAATLAFDEARAFADEDLGASLVTYRKEIDASQLR